MRALRQTLALLMLLCALASCSKFTTYDGPQVTKIVVFKERRVMRLFSQDSLVKQYNGIDLGFSPKGPKRFSGDGKTPEGLYRISYKNPNSLFYLSLGISYPNRSDVYYARARGRSPGGNIVIHGQGQGLFFNTRGRDWTEGCIALTNLEMRQLYAMVGVNTPIMIFP